MNIKTGFVHQGTPARVAVPERAHRMACARALQQDLPARLYAGKTGCAARAARVEAGSSTHQAQLVLKQAGIDGTREFRAAPLEPIRLHLTDLKEN